MENQTKIFDLIESTKQEFAAKGYTRRAKSEAHATFRQLIKYAYNRGEMYYTPELATAFLKDEWGYPVAENKEPEWRESTIKHKLSAVRFLN